MSAGALARLTAWQLRRVLPLPGVLAFAALGALLLLASGAPPHDLSALAGVDSRASWRDQTLWTGLLCALVPWLVLRAADAGERRRRRDRDWFDAARPPRAVFGAACWSASTFAALVVCGAAFAASSLATRDAHSAWRRTAGLDAAPSALVPSLESAPLAWTVRDSPRGAGRVSVMLGLAPGIDPDATVELAVKREGGADEAARARVVLSQGARLEVDVPAGDGALHLELRRTAGGAIVFLRDPSPDWSTETAAWAPSASIALAALLALAAACALAVGFGSYVSPTLAVLLTSLPWITALGSRAVADLIPGAELPGALAALSEGRALDAVDPLRSIATAGLVVIGLVLATLGDGRARE